MDSSEQERAEARAAAREQKRKPKLTDNRRSVFMLARLSTEPQRRRAVRRKRGA